MYIYIYVLSCNVCADFCLSIDLSSPFTCLYIWYVFFDVFIKNMLCTYLCFYLSMCTHLYNRYVDHALIHYIIYIYICIHIHAQCTSTRTVCSRALAFFTVTSHLEPVLSSLHMPCLAQAGTTYDVLARNTCIYLCIWL